LEAQVADLVPNQSDPRWKEVLSEQRNPTFSALATRLLVTRLRQTVRSDPTSIAAAVQELHKYFTANGFAQRDLSNL
jgi:hypothetical protein